MSSARCGSSVPDDLNEALEATADITFDLKDASTPLAIDFAPDKAGRVRACACNGREVSTTLVHGHLVIPPEVLREARNTLHVDFDAGDAPLNRRKDYLYSLFVPARAHEALPCFDQPDIKARWTLTVDLPLSWVAVSNGAEQSRRSHAGPSGRPRSIVSFATTEPIPTYLFAFVAGRFTVEAMTPGDRPIRIFHRETDRGLLVRNIETIANLHADALAWLEGYTSIPYPFGSFDVVLVPDFQFGGMEHPGAIYYSASALLLDESATRQQLLARAHVIAHETAHMWFGDLVTMRWFDDVWMKEVFANFMAARIVNPSFPDLDHEIRFLHAHYPGAYDVDRTAGTNAIRQPLDNLLDAGSLYGAIIYLKSPIVMRQLEIAIGAGALREGVHEYLRRFAFANASWSDLIGILDERTPLDLHRWSRDWIDEAGRPAIHADLSCLEGAIERLALRSVDTTPDRQLHWPQRLTVALGYGSRVEHVTIDLNGEGELAGATGLPAPDFVLPNGKGLGYGDIRLDAASLAWLSRHLPRIGDPLTRASAWVTLWDSMLNGQLEPSAMVDLMLAALPHETNDLNTLRILAWLDRAFWVFLTADERAQTASRIEGTLRERLDTGATHALKGAFFGAIRAMATTADAIGWLREVWASGAGLPGLPLGEGDRVLLAEELAVRGLPDGDAILRLQLERTRNEERRAALAFVAPALSEDARVRDGFVSRLSDAGSRRREPWVLDGLRWLHHPLRQPSSIRYVAPCLDLLEEVRRTGDIFLPKRWADATLGSHSSPEAAAVVRDFLDSRPPSYPPPLRRVVLASGDALFRASAFRDPVPASGSNSKF